MGRGALLVFEGCDRVGKSTQAKLLVEALQAAGMKCKSLRFPDRSTSIGKMIDSYLLSKTEMPDQSVHLLFSANRWELEAQMRQDLMNGSHIIIDRYAFSGVAYTAAKQVAPLSWCKAPDVGLPRPDRVFYLNLPADVAEQRDVYGKERYETLAFQKLVKEEYENLRGEEWINIDASLDIDSVHSQILENTHEVIKSCSSSPIAKLWTS